MRHKADLATIRGPGAVSASSGPLTMRTGTARRSGVPPMVAFAIPRRVGSAPVRNRVRRRLREILRQIVRSDPELVPAAVYLIQVRPGGADLSSSALREHVVRMLGRLQGAGRARDIDGA